MVGWHVFFWKIKTFSALFSPKNQNTKRIYWFFFLFFSDFWKKVLPCSFTLLSPLEFKKKFSDRSRRFEFEWTISGQGLKIGLALKSRFTRENLRFSKSFQTGQGCLSSRGDNKVNEHGKYFLFLLSCIVKKFYFLEK